MKKNGFTLIELLIVIGIIGVLVTLGLAAVNMARNKANRTKALHDTDVIYQAVATLANDTNSWPNHQEVGHVCSGPCSGIRICGPDAASDGCAVRTLDSGLAGLTQNDAVNPYSGWSGPYILQMPRDAWGREYFFFFDYRVYPDGTPCDDGSPNPLCVNAAVIGSYGPDGLGLLTGNPGDLADDIIKIISRE